MRSLNILILFIFLANFFFLVSCSESLQVSVLKTPNVNLADYKTYAWVAPGDSALNHRRDDKVYAGLIQHSADVALKKKGMTIDSQNPDAVFMFDTFMDEKTEYRQSPTTTASFGVAGYGFGYGGPGYYAGTSAPIYGGGMTPISVEEGTLMYFMYDRKTGKLLWKGSATATMSKKMNVESTIRKATNFIFAKLSVKPEKTK